jgi:8-oxo-dGTP pyrophosphatase MutT (NUDIX family)
MLHRAQHGPDYAGDWAWTVPSGCRFPGEDIIKAAHRELYEEAGLMNQEIHLTDCGTEEWIVFISKHDGLSEINLVDPEHDRFEWLLGKEAIARVSPERVQKQFIRTIEHIAKLVA